MKKAEVGEMQSGMYKLGKLGFRLEFLIVQM
jgi:hypothetical protein